MFKWLKDWGNEVKDKFQAVVPGFFGGGWLTSAYLTDPRVNDILVDTGALPAGIYRVIFYLTSSATLSTLNLTYQHRNKSNDVNISAHSVGVHNAQGAHPFRITVKVREGERFRVVARQDITGVVMASINYVRDFPLIKGQ